MWFGESEANVRDVFDKVRVIMSVSDNTCTPAQKCVIISPVYHIALNSGGENYSTFGKMNVIRQCFTQIH